MPQPNFVPVIPRMSRSTQRSGVSPSTSTLPLTSLTLIAFVHRLQLPHRQLPRVIDRLILARLALRTIRAASQHFGHCCPGWPVVGGPLYLCA